MTDALRYIQLTRELLLKREQNGGPLLDTLESEYIEQFDRCWQAMSYDEQQQVERVVAQLINAPDGLQKDDAVVARGQSNGSSGEKHHE